MRHLFVTIGLFGGGIFTGYSIALFGIKKLLDSGELIRRHK
jgi:hypothetical protein